MGDATIGPIVLAREENGCYSPLMRIGLGTLICFGVACSNGGASGAAQRADRLRRAGDLGPAYALYQQAFCAEPGSLDLARAMVEIWDELGRPGPPRARVDGCAASPAMLAYIDGLAAGAAGHLVAAEIALAKAEAGGLAAAHGEVAYRRGLVALGAQDPVSAHAHLSRAAGLEPLRAEIRLAMARAFLLSGHYVEVVRELRGMLRIEPSSREVEQGRALIEAAVRASQPPLPQGVQATLAEILSSLERGDLNQQVLRRALDLADEMSHPRVLTVAGMAALRIGAHNEARRLLELAAEANPLDPDPMRALGISYYATDRASEALPPLKLAYARDPLDAELANRLAVVAAAHDEHEIARDTYLALTALEPAVVEHHLWLARTQRRLGNFEAAVRAVEAGYQLDRYNIPLLLERAALQAQLARVAPTSAERETAANRARDAVAALLEVAPEHPGAAPILDRLEE